MGKPSYEELNKQIKNLEEVVAHLREKESQLSNTLEYAPIGIVTTLKDGSFRSVNPAFCEIIGYSEEELLSMSIKDITHNDYLAEDTENLTALWNGDTTDFESEIVYIKKDGKTITGKIRVTLVRNSAGEALFTVGELEDITDRKNMQDSLMRSEGTLELMINTAPDIIYRLDEDGNIVFVNSSIESLGYSPGELIGTSIFDIVHPDDRDRAVYRVNERRRGDRGTRRYELRLMRKSSGSVHYEEKSSEMEGPVFMVDAEGFYEQHTEDTSVFLGTLGIARDITDRKLAEIALKESEKKHRSLFETLTQGVIYTKINESIFDLNPAAEKILGRKLEELKGSQVFDASWKMINLDGTPVAYDLHPAHLSIRSGKPVKNVVMGVFNREKNCHVWININAIPQISSEDGEIKDIYITIEDVTERKKAEEALLRTRYSIDQALDSIYWIGPKGEILDVNEAACNGLGYTREELLTMGVKDIVRKEPENYASMVWPERWKKIKTVGSYRFETENTRKDGTIQPVEIVANYTEFSGQEYMVAFARDLTERKKTENIQKAIYNILDATINTRSLADLLKEIHSEISKLMDARNFYVALYDKTTDRYNFPYFIDSYDNIETISRIKIKKGLTEYVRSSEKPLLMDDYNRDEICRAAKLEQVGKRAKSWIGVPLMFEDEAVGVVAVQSYENANAYSENDLNILNYVSAQIALAIERKRNEEQLSESSQKMALHVEQTPLAVIEWDLDFRVREWNKSATDIFEFTKEEAIGKPGRELIVPKEVRGQVDSVWRDLVNRHGGSRSTNENMTKSGKRIICEWYNTPLIDHNGKVIGITSLVMNITTRKRAEEALQKSEEKYRDLFEKSLDSICIVDTNGRYLEVNEATEKLFGYSREEFLTMKLSDLVHPDDRENSQLHIEKLKETGFYENYEGRVITKGGNIRHIEVNANAIYENGKMVGSRDIIRDITERKKSEAQKKKLEEQLLQSQKMESIGRLAGGIAHDFNNILTGIMGYAELLKLKFEDTGSYEGKAADVIFRGAERAGRLTQQLLGFARVGRFNPEPLNINDEIVDTVRVMEKIFDKNINVEYNLSDHINNIEADKNQLDQVLTNIMINAKDAMPAGGDLICTTGNAYLDEKAVREVPDLQPGNYVKTTISDTGSGIPDSIIDKIFEPFFTTKGKGTGLGLATVYGIVKNHRGHITVESGHKKGTTFSIYLPVTTEKVSQVKDEETSIRGSSTVLIVDDEESVRDLTNEMLNGLGYRTFLAENGKEAVEIYKNHKDEIDLVILDMVMPEMAGSETNLRLREIDPEVRVMLSSGYSQEGKAKDILKDGALGFIQKPFRMQVLSEKISWALSQ